ncbi:unnamed protein product, partial [Rotaria magnacalcarata]
MTKPNVNQIFEIVHDETFLNFKTLKKTVALSLNNNALVEQALDISLTCVVHRLEKLKSTSSTNNDNNDIIKLPVAPSGNITYDEQFLIDDQLKMFFQNEMRAHYVASNESDESVV